MLPDRLRESLEKQGAAKAGIQAVIDAVSPATGMPTPVSRYVTVVRGGEAEVNEVLPGASMSGPEVVDAGPIPDLVPLLKARGEDFPYVVAEVGRDGGEVHLQYARRNGVAETTTVEVTGEPHQHPGGGRSQGRYQHRTEEIWRKNADEIAAEIDRVVQASKARLLIIAGDIRARELVVEQLSEASRAIESTFELTHPHRRRRQGSASGRNRRTGGPRLDRAAQSHPESVGKPNRTGASGVDRGLGECIRAWQQAQVGTLIMNDNALADHHVNVLNVEPWIATAGEQPVNGELLAKIPAPAALVRAAALTDARVAMAEVRCRAERASRHCSVGPPARMCREASAGHRDAADETEVLVRPD